MNSQKQAVLFVAILLVIASATSFAAVPGEINFQARVTDSLGNPINDTVDITLKIYDDPFAPTELWSETHLSIPLVDIEIVELKLSSVSPFPVDLWDNDDLWMGITVNTDPEITPRIQLLSVPFSLRSEGIMGHVRTENAKLHIEGSVGNPPRLYLRDDASVTPGVDEYIRISDLSVSIVVDRGPGDVDWLVAKADELSIWHTDGTRANTMDRQSIEIRTDDAPELFPYTPPSDMPYIALSDDSAGQTAATVLGLNQIGLALHSFNDEHGQMLPHAVEFYSGSNFGARYGYSGLTIHGGAVELLDGTDLTVTGTLDLTGGTLDLSSSGLAVGLDLDVDGHLNVAGGGSLTAGGTLDFSGPGDGALTIDQNGITGTLSDPTPSARVTLSTDGLALTDLTTTTDLVLLDRSSGAGSLTLRGSGSTLTLLDDERILLMDGIAEVFNLSRTASGGTVTLSEGTSGGSLTLTADDLTVLNPGGDLTVSDGDLELQPSGGGAGGRITISSEAVLLTDELSSDVLSFDRLGGITVVLGSSGTSAFYRSDGVQLTGPDVRSLNFDRSRIVLTRASLNDAMVCDLDDANDLLYCDLDDDGLRDIRFEHTPSNALHLMTGTELRCDDLATFSESVVMSSDLTVSGTLDLSGGTLELSTASLTLGGDLEVGGSLTVDGGRIFSDGAGVLTFDGPAASVLTLSESGLVSDLGTVVVQDATGGVTLASEVRSTGLVFRRDATDVAVVTGDLDGGRLELVDLSGGSLLVDGASLTLDDGLSTPLVLGRGASGGTVVLADGSGGGSVSLSADDIAVLHSGGDVRLSSGTVLLEPSGGGAGGRLTLSSESVTLADDLGTDILTLHRSDGLELVSLSGGSVSLSNSDGLLLVNPDGSSLDGRSRSIVLTGSSLNERLVCTLDDPVDVFYCDLDDDGLRDVRCQYLPTKELVLESGTSLRCNDLTSMTDCDVSGTMNCRDTWSCDANDDGTIDMRCEDVGSGPRCVVDAGTEWECQGPAKCTSTLEVDGTMDCSDHATFHSDLSCDANDDGTVDVECRSLTGPELVVATGTQLICEGLSTFAQPMQVNSDVTITGQLQVFGPKAFVQQHPEDATKEIVYVALEGNEAGTYTRGSSQLVNGVAEIELPEDFHLVTNADGITAQITPRGPVQSMLYVESVTPTKLIVKASNKKDASVKFDFMVNGVRAGFENHQVIRDKKSVAMAD